MGKTQEILRERTMELVQKIKDTALWQVLKKIKRMSYYAFGKARRLFQGGGLNDRLERFDGKIFTPAIQKKIKRQLKNRSDIYFHDEKTARNLAENWQGEIIRPQNLKFIENAIPVVMSANEYFAPYMAVMLQSLLDNSNPQRKYHFVLFEQNFSENTKIALMDQMLKFPYCEIDFINTESALDKIPIACEPDAHFSIDTFSRFFIPYWLEKYPKVIYLDGDMLAKADIAELYDLDIQNNCMGAVLSPAVSTNVENRAYSFFGSRPIFLYLDNWLRYIQAGVLVFDTGRFRERFSYSECFKLAIYYTNRHKRHFVDQDVLALLVKEDYFVLPPEWNYSWYTPYTGYRPARQDTKLFHYTTSVKPWKNLPEIANNWDVLAYRNYAKTVSLFKQKIELDNEGIIPWEA